MPAKAGTQERWPRLWIPACERVKESHFCVWRGLKFLSLALR
jgi:hypothetical protein